MANEPNKSDQDEPFTFDEGESRPAPIESTGDDNVRSMPLSSPAIPPDEDEDTLSEEDSQKAKDGTGF